MNGRWNDSRIMKNIFEEFKIHSSVEFWNIKKYESSRWNQNSQLSFQLSLNQSWTIKTNFNRRLFRTVIIVRLDHFLSTY